jgi:DtxR family Mn-dependent transcriptional regulator
MASVSEQDYLQTIYRLQSEEAPVSTTALAESLGVAPASVTGMLHKLHREGLVKHVPYQGVVLTDDGEREALRMIRRHRLWELFLTEVLGLPWDEVHLEAHRLEHATSDRVMERLAAFLHDPESDPHGQRIPLSDGTLPRQPWLSLAEARPGQLLRVLEVPDSDSERLRRLGGLGLFPGTEFEVVSVQAGELILRLAGRDLSLDRRLARQVRVTEASPYPSQYQESV